jgi:hypothetical protein
MENFGAIKALPAAATPVVRNDMLPGIRCKENGAHNQARHRVRVMGVNPAGFSGDDMARLKSLRSSLGSGNKFIPTWVKVSVIPHDLDTRQLQADTRDVESR